MERNIYMLITHKFIKHCRTLEAEHHRYLSQADVSHVPVLVSLNLLLATCNERSYPGTLPLCQP